MAFSVTTSLTPEQIADSVGNAAQIAGTTGPKVSVSGNADGGFDGIIKNFAGVTFAEFTVLVDEAEGGGTVVMFRVDDFFRTRETLFFVIPVSPWGAPGYRTLRAFAEHLHEALQRDTARL